MAMAFVAVLENDLRALCAEARRRYPSVKDAAERAILKLRSVSDPASIAKSDDVLRTFVLACETKHVKLCVIGLACLQKLIAHDAVAPSALSPILVLLKESAESFDESVQLKTLQTVLTVLQSQLQPEEEDSMSTLLGICLRLLGNGRTSDSVHSTAAATLRQAVALIFDRVLQAEGLPSNPRGHRMSRSNSVSGDVSRSIAQTKLIDAVMNDGKRALRTNLTPQARMGLRLLEDLNSLACGGQATWLAVPAMPRMFSLDMVEYVLSNYVSLFLRLEPFEQVLRQRVCTLLMTSLRTTGEIEGEAGEPYFRRLLLRAVGTVARYYSAIITTEVEVFLTMLIKAMDMDLQLWYRIYVLEILRGFCVEARVLRTIFLTFDMRPKNSNVVADMVACLARVVSVVHGPATEAGEESLAAVAGIFSSKAKGGVEWLMDFDPFGGSSQLPGNEAHAIALALEGLLGVVFTVATLTDEAMEAGELESPRTEVGDNLEIVPGGLADLCRRMVESVWVTLLEALSLMMSKSVGEAVVVEVLKGYQAFTQACGVLRLEKPRDAFLSSLCKFTLAHQHDPTKRLGEAEAREGVILTPKNVQALRTLFNVAHRLDSVLGPSWTLVLETLAALDRTLHAPHATTQELSSAPRVSRDRDGVATQSADFHVLSSLDSQLFENSSTMSDSAVHSLLCALRQVCNNSLLGVTSGLGLSASGSTTGTGTSVGVPTQAVPKMFAVERMVDTVVHNMQRVNRLWGEVVAHLLELSCHESAQVRVVAMDALDRSITAVLGCEKILEEARAARMRECREGAVDDATINGNEVDRGGNSDVKIPRRRGSGGGRPGDGHDGCAVTDKTGCASGSGGAIVENAKELQATDSFECIVILPLSMLYHSGRDVEVRAGALRIVLHALERHGEQLYHSWSNILRLQREVADSAEKDLVPLGFQGVTVVMNDCLASLPKRLVKTCVEVAGAYGSQRTDVNISLTAIGLLWTTVDFFARGKGAATASAAARAAAAGAGHGDYGLSKGVYLDSPIRQSNAEEGGSASGAGSQVTHPPIEVGSSSNVDGRHQQKQQQQQLAVNDEDMLYTIFCMIKSLGTDERPEVRNSAIRTLFASIVSHGGKLSQDLWRSCLWKLLFPLLETVRHLAANSSRDEWVGKELGKQGGKPVHMLVHHSRNTAQKQWDETLVVALNGMSRLLRSFFTVVHKMDGFEAVWESLLQFVEESVLAGSKEVALAAVNALCMILQTYGAKMALPRYYWQSAFQTLDVIARNSAHSDSRVPLKARTELLENLGALYKSCYAMFVLEDYLLMLAMVDVLVRYPVLQADPPVLTTGVLPQVQRTALEVLPLMFPRDGRLAPLWPQFLRQLITYLPGGNRVLCEHLRIPAKYAPPPQSAEDGHHAGSGGWRGTGLKGEGEASSNDQAEPTMQQENGQDDEGYGGNRIGHSTLTEREDGSREPSEVGSPKLHHTVAADTRGFPDTAPGALSYGFAERIVPLLVDLYLDQTPPSARSLILPDVFGGLGRCMGVRRDAPDVPLWRIAVSAFDRALGTALIPDAANGSSRIMSEGRDQDECGPQEQFQGSSRLRLWKELVHLFERFLVGTCGRAVVSQLADSISPETQKTDEMLELFVLDALCEKVLVSCRDAPVDVKARLVSVVDRCAGRTSSLPVESVSLLPQNCGRFSLVCLRKMFMLCGRGAMEDSEDSSVLQVARVALPVLISRCESILKRFAEDEEHTEINGMPAMRMEELICLLQELARLMLHPLVSASLDVPVYRKDRSTTNSPAPLTTATTEATASQRRLGSPIPAVPHGPFSEQSSRSSSSFSSANQGHGSTPRKQSLRFGWERVHLLMLYTPLCELIVSDDMQIRELMRVLLRLAGGELGLLKDTPAT